LKSVKKERILTFLVFVLPALAIYIYLFVMPFLKTFYYCFTDWNGVGKEINFVGLDNFVKLFKDKQVWHSLWNNIQFCVIGGILTFGIAIFNAVIITQSSLGKGERKFYRIAFYIPNILSTVIVTLMWMFIYNPNWGILNGLLELLGLGQFTDMWLGNKSTVVPALIVVWVWMSVGFYMVMYIAAIEAIPHDLFEAADLDGANVWHKFKNITWPLIIETTKTNLVFFFINAFSGVYTLVDIMTDGGPAKASNVLTYYMYDQAFAMSKFGYATAIGVFTFFVVLLVSGVMLLATRRKEVIEF